jgi:anti-anti-sigma factor
MTDNFPPVDVRVELNHPHRLVVAGDLDVATIPVLLERSINLPPDDLVIDCTRVEFMDAAALNGFVALNAALSRRGQHLRINGLRPPTRRLFELTGLDQDLDLGP